MFQLLGCMYGWMTFYHQGHEMANDSKGQMRDLQIRLQKVRRRENAESAERCFSQSYGLHEVVGWGAAKGCKNLWAKL